MHATDKNENCIGYINYGEEDQMVSQIPLNTTHLLCKYAILINKSNSFKLVFFFAIHTCHKLNCKYFFLFANFTGNMWIQTRQGEILHN